MRFQTQCIPDAKWNSGSANIHDIEISEVAYKALGATPDPNYVLKYMLRRFGLPLSPIDEYKDLCKWILSTPIPGFWLSVHPNGGSGWGYLASKEVHKEIHMAIGQPQRIRTEEVKVWAKEKYGISLFTPTSFSWFALEIERNGDQMQFVQNEEWKLCIEEYNQWQVENNLPDLPSQDDEMGRLCGDFAKYKDAQIKEYNAIYNSLYPETETKKPFLEKYEQAIIDTSTDLLRFTNIRDGYFNIIEDDEDWTIYTATFKGAFASKWNSLMRKLKLRKWNIHIDPTTKSYFKAKAIFGDEDMFVEYFDLNKQIHALIQKEANP